PRPHNPTNDNTNVESFSSFPNQENEPRQEEIDVFSIKNNVLPPSNDDSDEEVDLRVDNVIQNSEHEYSESEDSDLDNPLLPLPPPEPPDKEFDFEIDFEKEISVVRNVIVKFECIDTRMKFDVENDVFKFIMFSLLSAESEDTIFDPESNEFIKSSAKNLVPNPSESKDDSECDVPACDDFTTFSNLLFDADDDFCSSDNKSFSDEVIPKEIYSNPLFDEEIISIKIDPHHFNVESDLIESLLNQDSSIISSSLKIDSLLNEFTGELILFKSIPPEIDEVDYDPKEEIRLIEKLLYDNLPPRPPKEFISENSDAGIKSFSPSPIPVEDSDSLMKEIDLTLTPNDSMPPGIKDDDYDSERDILILEEFLSNDSLSLPENESFHFDISSSPRPPTKPSDDDEIKPNSGIMTVKVVGDIFEQYVPMISDIC
nr:hypothetical protein [Tanacetum cinerariifolium]